MLIDSFNTDDDILVVAEIGNNHEGRYALAEELIGLAARAGVGAVKFQTFKTEYYVSHKDEARFNRLKSFELTESEFEKLSQVAKRENVLFLSTPFDIESAQFLDKLVPAFKISSGDNNFFPLIEVVAQTGKPIILSAGLTDMEQITATRDFIQTVWSKSGINQEMTVLHCVVSAFVPWTVDLRTHCKTGTKRDPTRLEKPSIVVPPTRFERVAFGLGNHCSIH